MNSGKSTDIEKHIISMENEDLAQEEVQAGGAQHENSEQELRRIVAEFPKGALVWYDFKENSRILYVYSKAENAAVKELLESCGDVTAAEIGEICETTGAQEISNIIIEKIGHKFDYIVGIDIIEESMTPAELLKSCRGLLTDDGKLLLGAENRFGVKYFCGDRDPYTNHSFDGVEGYKSLLPKDRDDLSGRCYSMAELRELLSGAGFSDDRFYSVLPSLQEAQLIYREDYTPVEDFAIRYFPLYNHPDSIYMSENSMQQSLIQNGMFHKTANAYVIECSLDGSHDNTLHATISLDRDRDNALVTKICEESGTKNRYATKKAICEESGTKNRYVTKKAIYPEGRGKLEQIQQNHDDIRARGINVIESRIENDTLIMPYVDAPIAVSALRSLARRDKDAYLSALDDMWELILQSSTHDGEVSQKTQNSANGADLGPILSKSYIDMVPINCFYDERIENPKDRFIFYDQEFYFENCPALVTMYRSITLIYNESDKEFEKIISKKEVMERYGVAEKEDMWSHISSNFTHELRNQKILNPYLQKKQVDVRIMYTNREIINFGSKDYNRIFTNIFDGCEGADGSCVKKIVLFGSGRFTKKFLFQFGDDYPIYSIIDNDSAKWGTQMEGIPVNSPEILRDIPRTQLHLIICVRAYNAILNQLADMGITRYHIYDPGNDYPNKRRALVAQRVTGAASSSAGGSMNSGDVSSSAGCRTNSGDVSLGAYEGTSLKDANVTAGGGADGEASGMTDAEKPYNVGYIAGVFDLFHIGHLNLFRRAKELCRYLIVGVVSDEGVRLNKQAEPYVPFDERIELVRACKYVDEAVKLPLDFCGTRDMYKIYHFDVQFSGSDYVDDPYWLSEKAWLEENGSEMVFFPYTQSTSSTKLKDAIERKSRG